MAVEEKKDERITSDGKPNHYPKSNASKKRPRDNFSQEEPIYDIKVNRKTSACARWNDEMTHLIITVMKGNFFRWMGFSASKKEMLYPEEALNLVEKAQLYIHTGDDVLAKVKSSIFYEKVMTQVPQECYLAYSRLHSLGYIVRRHRPHAQSSPLYAFKSEMDAYTHLKAHPELSVLDAMASFRIYVGRQGRTKRSMMEGSCGPCDGYVVVVTADHTLSARVMFALLEEANGVPIIVAALMPTGHIMLQEFCDAETTLNWNNDVKPHPFYLPMLEEEKREEKETEKEQLDEYVDMMDQNVVPETKVAHRMRGNSETRVQTETKPKSQPEVVVSPEKPQPQPQPEPRVLRRSSRMRKPVIK